MAFDLLGLCMLVSFNRDSFIVGELDKMKSGLGWKQGQKDKVYKDVIEFG